MNISKVRAFENAARANPSGMLSINACFGGWALRALWHTRLASGWVVDPYQDTLIMGMEVYQMANVRPMGACLGLGLAPRSTDGS